MVKKKKRKKMAAKHFFKCCTSEGKFDDLKIQLSESVNVPDNSLE